MQGKFAAGGRKGRNARFCVRLPAGLPLHPVHPAVCGMGGKKRPGRRCVHKVRKSPWQNFRFHSILPPSMHFPLRHSGLRFFFLTLATEGRCPVLSRLVRGASRPEETETGACVASVWRGLHAADPALTASDRVLMPDHAHLLLLVRGEVEFNPLVFARWFMEATEDAVAELAWGVPEGASRWIAPSARGAKEGPPRLWSREAYVEISFDSVQLRAIRRLHPPQPGPLLVEARPSRPFRTAQTVAASAVAGGKRLVGDGGCDVAVESVFVPGAAVPEYAARHASRRCGHRRRRGQGPARLDSPVRLHLGRRARVREAAQATSPHQIDQDRSLRIARPLRPGRRGLPMALRRPRTAVERFGRCRLSALEGDARGLPDHECPKCRPLCRLGPLKFGGRPMARGAGRGRGRGSR